STLSNRLKTSSRLFSLLSKNSSIDHPLCSECTQLLLDGMSAEVEEVRKEVERYKGFEGDVLRRRKEKGRVGVDGLEQEIRALREREQSVREEVGRLEERLTGLEGEIGELEREEEELEREEEAFWRSHNAYLTDLERYTTRSRSLLTRYKHDSQALEKLQRTNVYNDAFCIGHEGGLATINGLRLGRLPNLPVDWPELNAAWGQTLLLLVTIARKLDCTFTSYKPIPQGSFSRLEKLSDHSILELYGSGDFGVGRLFLNRRFDHAMVAFLELLRQLMDHAMERGGKSRGLRLHHQVVKDKIGDVSIKLQFGSDETWTRALRHVLLNVSQSDWKHNQILTHANR
ncbi:autophagy protein 6, partial [Atractiella rhizophila]